MATSPRPVRTATAPAATRKTAARKAGSKPPAPRSHSPRKLKSVAATSSKPATPATPDASASTGKPPKIGKTKLVRDSFTMPQSDIELIADIKRRAVKLQRPAKKSEVLRAGLHALRSASDPALLALLEGLEVIRTGRPKKGH